MDGTSSRFFVPHLGVDGARGRSGPEIGASGPRRMTCGRDRGRCEHGHERTGHGCSCLGSNCGGRGRPQRLGKDTGRRMGYEIVISGRKLVRAYKVCVIAAIDTASSMKRRKESIGKKIRALPSTLLDFQKQEGGCTDRFLGHYYGNAAQKPIVQQVKDGVGRCGHM